MRNYSHGCHNSHRSVWLGFFSYAQPGDNHDDLLSVSNAFEPTTFHPYELSDSIQRPLRPLMARLDGCRVKSQAQTVPIVGGLISDVSCPPSITSSFDSSCRKQPSTCQSTWPEPHAMVLVFMLRIALVQCLRKIFFVCDLFILHPTIPNWTPWEIAVICWWN